MVAPEQVKVASAAQGEPAPTSEVEAPEAGNGRRRGRVLVAEDNPVNQRVAVRMLEKLGYDADVVADGREAEDALERIPYDLVLMDCQMPEMDGYEATVAIRLRERDAGRRTPIVAMTANALAGEAERCFAVGMDDYLAKPVKLEHLAAVLKRWVQGSSTTSANDAVDPAVLAGLRELEEMDEPGLVAELVQLFLQDTTSRLGTVREALARGDAMALGQVAHTLKGSCANIGAGELARLCEALEAASRRGDLHAAAEAQGKLDAEYDRVRSQLSGLLARDESFTPT